MKAQETQLEVRLSDLKYNVNHLKSFIKDGVQFMAVVKASSYGTGSEPIAMYLERENLADYFAVAFASEGVALRKAGITRPIMVFHPQEAHFECIVSYNLEPAMYSTRIFELFTSFLKQKNSCDYPVHLKCNTGFNRLGFSISEIEMVCKEIASSKQMKVMSAYAHLSASEDLSEEPMMRNLISNFLIFQQKIQYILPYSVKYHMCNTSGILNYPQAHFDMVRSGIGMYGFANDAKRQSEFKPIASLKTIISQIHNLKKGDVLGYNRGFVASGNIKTATLPIGHADGIHRIFGKGRGFVFIKGKKAPILGNVCMDAIMVDISDIDCQEGDEVIVFDKNHLAEDLALSAGTISYELITSLSGRIKRIFMED